MSIEPVVLAVSETWRVLDILLSESSKEVPVCITSTALFSPVSHTCRRCYPAASVTLRMNSILLTLTGGTDQKHFLGRCHTCQTWGASQVSWVAFYSSWDIKKKKNQVAKLQNMSLYKFIKCDVVVPRCDNESPQNQFSYKNVVLYSTVMWHGSYGT